MRSANIKSPRYDIVLTKGTLAFIEGIVSSGRIRDQRIDRDWAFDVGAYVGSSVPRLRAMGFRKVTCFEADPATYSQLVRNYGPDPDIDTHQVALTSQNEGEIVLYKCDRGRDFLNTMDSSWITDTRHKALVSNMSQVSVKRRTLDSFVRDAIPAYVKIDVEGHELEVMHGIDASKRPALLSFEWISELPGKNRACLERARELGYERFDLSTRGEEVPGPGDAWLGYDDALREFDRLRKDDSSNDVWGNCWCV